jgi:transcription-repair coupling factor (superfamily II helicase)
MIIHRADRYGLAQLYQLRGRVGRAKTRAYAYFTYEANRLLTETAQKRLQVLASLESLGAGFQLATHDLDIRGAGNLLGDEQSGHIKEVGFELYQSMLEEAILEAKSGGASRVSARDFSPQINVDAPILIPDDYVPDLDSAHEPLPAPQRTREARRDRRLRRRADRPLRQIAGRDREPPQDHRGEAQLPQGVHREARRRAEGRAGPLLQRCVPDLEGLITYVQHLKGTAKLRPDHKLVITRDFATPAHRLNGAVQVSRGLAKIIG